MRKTITFAIAAVLLARPSHARALDLETTLREVAAGSPALAARRAMVTAAERRVSPAGAWDSPMLEVGVINVPTSGRFDLEDMTMKMVGVSQRVPVFGSRGLSKRSAREAAGAEAAGSEMAEYEAWGMAFEAYGDSYYAGALAREALNHRAVMDRLVSSARARYESGNGRLEDVLRAEAERARSLVDLASFRAEEQQARARLDALRGVVPGGTADTLAPPPAPSVPADPAPWLAAVAPVHPRLRELDAQANRYKFAARAARRMVWPDLQLGLSYGLRQTLADGMKQENMYSATVGVMLPIFARQRELAEGAEMDAMARASEAERHAAELELLGQVRGTHAAANAAQRTVSLLADTVVATQSRAVDASWVAYGAGSTDLWRVFEASHALYTEEIALQRARQDLVRAGARMLSLTGRGDLLGVITPAVRRSGQ